MSITMLKLGGSLLSQPDIVDRILALKKNQKLEHMIIVVGGGQAAELIRQYDSQFDLPTEASHHLAIHAMALNARLLSELHADFELVADSNAAINSSTLISILDPVQVLRELEAIAPENNLSASWDTTSDSIAAWICARLSVRRLIMLKSTGLAFAEPDRSADCIRTLIDRELLDKNFADASIGIPRIEWCNLRSPESEFPLTRLR